MKKRITNIIWGICLILFGIGIAGNALELWNFTIFFKGWWTLFLIIPCAAEILSGNTGKGAFLGLAGGLLLMFTSWEALSYSDFWRSIFPVILILSGIQMLVEHLAKEGWFRTILLSAAVLAVVGLTISVAAWRASSSDKEMAAEEKDFQEVFAEEDIRGLSVDAADMQVYIEPGSQLKVFASDISGQFQAFVEDGSLIVKNDKDFLDGLFNINDTEVTITVPEGMNFEKLLLSCDSGSLTAEGLTAEVFTFRGGSGDSYFSNLTVLERAELKTGSGDAVFEETSLANPNITSGSGSLSFSGNLDGSCRMLSGSGSTVYALSGNLNNYYIEGRSGSGDIWLNGEKYSNLKLGSDSLPNTIKITGGSGRIVMDFSGESLE